MATSSLVALFMFVLCGTAQAQFTFTTNNNTITVVGYTGTSGDVTIPSTANGLPVTCIGSNAFSYCTFLTNVVIPDSVTNIGYGAFGNCSSLTTVTFGTGLTTIEGNAFTWCTKLTSVTIPSGVTTIGNGAFYECTGITNVTLPQGLINLGNSAFFWCISLSGIRLPDSLNNIGEDVFHACRTATNITMGDSVTNIGDRAFNYCTNLTNIRLSTNLLHIGEWAFVSSSLTNITLPSSVTSIGEAALAGGKLTMITVDALNPVFISVDGILFDKSQTTLIQYPGGRVGSYRVPDGVLRIGASGFRPCHLTSITLPNSITNVEAYSFGGAASLQGIYCEGNAPNCERLQYATPRIYYLPGTTGWGSTWGGRPTAWWYLPNPIILNQSLGLESNLFGFIISWATNRPVVVEGCTDLIHPDWQPLQTNTLTDGTAYFSDWEWTNYPHRFYHLSSP